MTAAIAPDTLKARATLIALGAAIDRLDWREVGECVADRLRLDYTSLFGGEAADLSRQELVDQWRALLPGFDATRHRIGEPEIALAGDTARGTAAVESLHLLDSAAWAVRGRYDFEMVRADDRLVITSLTLLLENEEGDRGLTKEAGRRAAQVGRSN